MKTLYYNGTILTMDETQPKAEAVLIADGRILAVGAREDMRLDGDTVCTDLHGRTILPGFLDGHSHFAGLATSLSQCDLSQAADFSDIIRRMRDFIAENHIPAGQWVTGTNYDHNFLREGIHPDKRTLDAVSEVHPVVLVHASSHMGVANSLAMRQQGLTDGMPDPAGGHYGRIAGTDALSGYMEENAFVAFRNAMPMPKIDDILQLFSRAQQIYASYGITTVQEGMVTPALFSILQCAEKTHTLYLDLVGYLDLEHCADTAAQHPEYGGYTNRFRIGGFKIFLDGSPQGRTAWMKEPYADAADGYRGYPVKTDAQLYALIETALKKHSQLLAHCNGDAAAAQYLTQFEHVLRDRPELEAHRPVMIHAQLVRPGELGRMAQIGMTPSFFVAHTYYWGDIHIRNFGIERASRISPAGSALRLGLPFTFHQDSPVLPPDVLRSVWCAAKRVTKGGVQLAKEECVSVYEGLKAATVYAAQQYGEAAEKGTIAPGKKADLVILDRNPLDIPLDDVKDARVLETIKDGITVFRREHI